MCIDKEYLNLVDQVHCIQILNGNIQQIKLVNYYSWMVEPLSIHPKLMNK